MGVDTQKYIRKPLYVDAVRVNAQNFDELVDWCQGEVQTEDSPDSGVTKKFIKVRVHNPKNPRQTKAFVGDWILYTERGYKVYTNKAFRGAFDEVETAEPKAEETAPTRLGPEIGHWDGDVDPAELDKPLSETEEAELQSEETSVDEHTTPQGEPHDYVEATPEAIADVVNEQQPVEPDEAPEETPDVPAADSGDIPSVPDPEQPPENVEGKRVLSREEQTQMGSDTVRELVSSGEVLLAQDLAETP